MYESDDFQLKSKNILCTIWLVHKKHNFEIYLKDINALKKWFLEKKAPLPKSSIPHTPPYPNMHHFIIRNSFYSGTF